MFPTNPGPSSSASTSYARAGSSSSASTSYTQAGPSSSASTSYDRAGPSSSASTLYDYAVPSSSASTYDHANPSSSASTSYARAGPSSSASTLYNHAGPSSCASTSYAHAGPSSSASTSYTRAGPSSSASTLYNHAGPSSSASTSYAHAGRSSSASTLYGRADLSSIALTLYGRPGPSSSASTIYDHAGPSSSASTSYAHAGPSSSASTSYARAGPSSSASTSYARAGPSSSALTSYGCPDPCVCALTLYNHDGPSSSASTYDLAGPSSSASTSYTRTGPSSSASMSYARAGPSSNASISYDCAGPSSSALTPFGCADPCSCALTLYNHAGPSSSASTYDLASPSSSASTSYARAGPSSNASISYDCAGPSSSASTSNGRAGPSFNASTSYDRAGPSSMALTSYSCASLSSSTSTSYDRASPSSKASTSRVRGGRPLKALHGRRGRPPKGSKAHARKNQSSKAWASYARILAEAEKRQPQSPPDKSSSIILIPDIKKICRVCNRASSRNKNLYGLDANSNKTWIPSKQDISDLFNIQISIHDFSHEICLECIDDVRIMLDFRKMALDSQNMQRILYETLRDCESDETINSSNAEMIPNVPNLPANYCEVVNEPISPANHCEVVNEPNLPANHSKVVDEPNPPANHSEVVNEPNPTANHCEVVNEPNLPANYCDVINEPNPPAKYCEVVDECNSPTNYSEVVNEPNLPANDFEVVNEPNPPATYCEVVNESNSPTNYSEVVNEPNPPTNYSEVVNEPNPPANYCEVVNKSKRRKLSQIELIQIPEHSPTNFPTSTQTTSELKSTKTSCPICCTGQNLLLSGDKVLCSRHERSYSCLVSKCFLVFTNKCAFIKHLRKHQNLDKRLYMCHQCYGVLGTKKNMGNKHQHKEILASCCFKRYTNMSEFVLHKIICHNSKIISSAKNIDDNEIPNDVSANQAQPQPSINEKAVVIDLRGKVFTCTVADCNIVYDSKKKNTEHYRKHAGISYEFSTCGNCLQDHRLIDGFRDSCDHKNNHIKCTTCTIEFSALHELAYHKLTVHNAVVLCGENCIPGCPVCSIVFDSVINSTAHYKSCFTKTKLIQPMVVPVNDDIGVLLKNNSESKVVTGSVKCRYCHLSHNSLNEYVTHAKRVHGVTYVVKERGIRLCPLCDLDYDSKMFVTHIGKCTESMLVDKAECFECVFCSCFFPDLSPRLFRDHFMFCKSFKKNCIGGKDYYECLNCDFINDNISSCTEHATSTCVYYQLKTKYALFSNEKKTVEERMRLQFLHSKMDLRPIYGCVVTGQDSLISGVSKLICNPLRRKLLHDYEYFCVYCNRRFFNENVFLNHKTIDNVKCRSKTSWYCKKCVVDFTVEDDFVAHVQRYTDEEPTPAIPTFTIKEEDSFDEQNNAVIPRAIPMFTIKDEPDTIEVFKSEPLDPDTMYSSLTNTYIGSENNTNGVFENGNFSYEDPALMYNTLSQNPVVSGSVTGDQELDEEMVLEFTVDVKPKIEEMDDMDLY